MNLKQIARRLRPVPQGKVWDGLYQAGETDRYGTLEQFARYAVIEGYCRWWGEKASILEIGCGTGILLSRMNERLIGDYVGIDISATAVESARETFPGRRFECSQAEKATFPDASFDLIIFNETLYYLPGYTAQLRRYFAFLKPGGYAIVSITGLRADVQEELEQSIAENLISQTNVVDRQSGKSWAVYLFSKVPAAR